MDKKGAIKILEIIRKSLYENSDFVKSHINEAIDIAIKSLEMDERLKAIEHLGHMNKSQAIEILENRKKENGWEMDRFYSLPKYQGKRSKPELENMAINIALESLKEERPKGKWKPIPYYKTEKGCLEYTYYHRECSVCSKQYDEMFNYCPNCGADMRESEAENDIDNY